MILGLAGNRRFSGSGRPRGPWKPFKNMGSFAPIFLNGFPGPQGRPDTENQRYPAGPTIMYSKNKRRGWGARGSPGTSQGCFLSLFHIIVRSHFGTSTTIGRSGGGTAKSATRRPLVATRVQKEYQHGMEGATEARGVETRLYGGKRRRRRRKLGSCGGSSWQWSCWEQRRRKRRSKLCSKSGDCCRRDSAAA
jgi:hypothetical protein